MGCWTPLEGFARARRDRMPCGAATRRRSTSRSFEVLEGGALRGTVEWPLIGAHNMENALAAIAAARHAGVEVRALHRGARADFKGIARRMQLRGEVRGVRVYDDFAHHPTAIATTIDGLRRRIGSGAHRSRCSSRARTPCAWACTSETLAPVARRRRPGVAVRAGGSGLGHRRGRRARSARAATSARDDRRAGAASWPRGARPAITC